MLPRAGWAVALVEKHNFPRRKVCGKCIASSNLPVLEALGIGTLANDAAETAAIKVVFGARSAAIPVSATLVLRAAS